jgi:hypothetical protein
MAQATKCASSKQKGQTDRNKRIGAVKPTAFRLRKPDTKPLFRRNRNRQDDGTHLHCCSGSSRRLIQLCATIVADSIRGAIIQTTECASIVARNPANDGFSYAQQEMQVRYEPDIFPMLQANPRLPHEEKESIEERERERDRQKVKVNGQRSRMHSVEKSPLLSRQSVGRETYTVL